MEAVYFEHPEAWRKWLAENHDQAQEIIVGYYKKHTGHPSIDWPQSVDQALCFGWIDGIRRSIDQDRYSIRFTPRRKNSIWSKVNLKRIEELDALGLLQPTGRKVWEERNTKLQDQYSFEQENLVFPAELAAMMAADEQAQSNWEGMAPSYKKAAKWWVISAKQASTRQKRMLILVECSREGLRIPSMRR